MGSLLQRLRRLPPSIWLQIHWLLVGIRRRILHHIWLLITRILHSYTIFLHPVHDLNIGNSIPHMDVLLLQPRTWQVLFRQQSHRKINILMHVWTGSFYYCWVMEQCKFWPVSAASSQSQFSEQTEITETGCLIGNITIWVGPMDLLAWDLCFWYQQVVCFWSRLEGQDTDVSAVPILLLNTAWSHTNQVPHIIQIYKGNIHLVVV